jgi:hypothetical protein
VNPVFFGQVNTLNPESRFAINSLAR